MLNVHPKVFTYITSPDIDHHLAVLQCFHFWFFIDGFMDGAKNESLKVVQQSNGDIPEKELWNWQSGTLEWKEVCIRIISDCHILYYYCRVKWRCERFSKMTSTLVGKCTCSAPSQGTQLLSLLWMTLGNINLNICIMQLLQVQRW